MIRVKIPQTLHKSALVILVLSSLFIIFIQSTINSLGLYKNVKQSFSSRSESSQTKIAKSWGDFQAIKNLLINNNLEKGSFMYPPQSADAWFGNGALLQYFLYPAKLYEENLQLIEDKKIDSILIKSDWPDFNVPVYKAYFEPVRTYVNIDSIRFGNNETTVNYLNFKEGPILERLSTAHAPMINAHSVERLFKNESELIDFSLTETGPEIWMFKLSQEIKPDSKLIGKIKVGKEKLGSLVAKVTYSDNHEVFFASRKNTTANSWEEISIDSLYSKATKLAELNRWSSHFLLTGIGVDMGIKTSGPFYSDGIALIENGNNKDLSELTITSSENLFLLSQKKYRLGETVPSELIQSSLLLNNDNTEAKLLLAKENLKNNQKDLALQILKENVELYNHLYSGIEMLSLISVNNYQTHKASIDKLILFYVDNNYLKFNVAQMYERLGFDILAYRYYMSSTQDYPYSLISVKAGHKLNEFKQMATESNEYEKAKKAYLDGRFGDSAKLMATLYAQQPANVVFQRSLEEGYIINEYDFEDQVLINRYRIVSGIVNKGVSLNEANSANSISIAAKSIYFPNNDRGLAEGTIEFFWQVGNSNLYTSENQRYFLLDQMGSLGRFKPALRLYINNNKMNLQVKDITGVIPKTILVSSEKINWEEGRWYHILISWNKDNLRLYIDRQLIGETNYKGRIGIDSDIYFTLAPDKSSGSIYNPNEFMAQGAIDNIKVLSYPKKYQNGVHVWD